MDNPRKRKKNTFVFFDVSADGSPIGKMVFEVSLSAMKALSLSYIRVLLSLVVFWNLQINEFFCHSSCMKMLLQSMQKISVHYAPVRI